jgi:antitoxin MazE
MKAAVHREYGPPDVVQIEDVEKPVPNDDEVLIEVRAASVNPLDWHLMRGKPYIVRVFTGLRVRSDQPKRERSNNVDTHIILGYHVDTMYLQEVDMRAVVKKWGNSASVRIPVAVLEAAHLDLDEPVDVREESGRIVIEPIRRKEYDLAELVKGITRENLHAEVSFGGPVGKEAW